MTNDTYIDHYRIQWVPAKVRDFTRDPAEYHVEVRHAETGKILRHFKALTEQKARRLMGKMQKEDVHLKKLGQFAVDYWTVLESTLWVQEIRSNSGYGSYTYRVVGLVLRELKEYADRQCESWPTPGYGTWFREPVLQPAGYYVMTGWRSCSCD